METVVDGESHVLYGNGIRKKPFEWDLNEWKWDSELLAATPVVVPASGNGMPSNSSSSGSEEAEADQTGVNSGCLLEKRRRVASGDEDGQSNAGRSFDFVHVRNSNMVGDNTTGKSSNPRVNGSAIATCQVDGCGADLSNLKDYHKRHKVCELHAKASTATVKNVLQRFCQQCSRFHLVQEFDEGKRSCRRRLEGHNRRRRKPCTDNSTNRAVLDESSSGHLLIGILRILSNLHAGSSDQSRNQDLLAQFLRSLADMCGSLDARRLLEILQASQNPSCGPAIARTSNLENTVLPDSAKAPASTRVICSTSEAACIGHAQGSLELSAGSKAKLKDFDLNSAYVESEMCGQGSNGTANYPYIEIPDSRQSSPQQTSGTSESTSGRSLSASNGDAQCRTDRIVFKLFGKDPRDLPTTLRAQILSWLANSPTDIEGYIRPGCIVLTIYFGLAESMWEEICSNFSLHLGNLLGSSNDSFWIAGWICARVQNCVALIYDGQIVLEAHLPDSYEDYRAILSVKPIAAPCSSRVNFTMKGLNLVHSTTRILCSSGGQYLVLHPTETLSNETDADDIHQEACDCIEFSTFVPDEVARGFVELEDDGLCNDFFPFIVAEPDICSEIRSIEGTIDIFTYDVSAHDLLDMEKARNEAIDFLYELGWLLRRNHLKSSCCGAFHLQRFKRLLDFSMDRDWCAVIKKLLDILFSGHIDLDEQSARDFALSQNLLHRAVRRKCRAMVELLLRYTPVNHRRETHDDSLIFKPDFVGFSGLTPLHVAAASSDAKEVLDALTNDPNMLGIKMWSTVRDCSGFTPEDYARLRGHDSYLDLIRKKVVNEKFVRDHIIIGVPVSPESDKNSLEITKTDVERPALRPQCNICSRQAVAAQLRFSRARVPFYRSSMLAMLAIATVCICVGILLTTQPKVSYVKPSFRWELLKRGPM